MPLVDALKSDPDYEIPKDIHFCKIDVEGFEKEVIEGIDFSEIRPWIFVVESFMPLNGIPTKDFWEHMLLKNGYLFACQEGANRYYVDERHKNLLESKMSVEQMKTEYDLYRVTNYSGMKTLGETIENSRYWRLGRAVAKPILPLYKAVERHKYKKSR